MNQINAPIATKPGAKSLQGWRPGRDPAGVVFGTGLS